MSKIDKLRAQERSERLLGNCSLADNLLAKIAAMENKSLVPVQVNSDAIARREVERRWEEMDPAASVVLLCIESGLSRAVRREMPMRDAIILLKAEKARLLGRADAEWVLPPQQDTSNCAPLNQKPSTTLFI
jgi:hypothetical protein